MLAHVLQFSNQLTALVACIQSQFNLALPFAPGDPLTSKLFETQHAAFVARASRFDALANPHFFLRQKFVELGVLDRLVVQNRFLPGQIGAEVSGAGEQTATIQFDDACRYAIQKTPVMGDEHHRHPR